jgi:major membrane immunogen (membrane-anchored lipoprotein)
LQEKDENGFHSKVTIELRGGIIVQAKGKFNRSVSKLESTIIRMWREENKEYISENLAA